MVSMYKYISKKNKKLFLTIIIMDNKRSPNNTREEG